MAPKEINTAVAEHLGWKIKGKAPDDSLYGYPPLNLPESSMVFETLPDYCGDLNAMHEAEETLSHANGQWIKYARQLLDHDIHATASERAEAFLRTVGKWKA